jgi:hypothetical protein
MGPIWRPEMSAANHQPGLRNSPEERRHYLHTGRFIRPSPWKTIIFPFRLVFLMERRMSSEGWVWKVLNHAFLCFIGWGIWWSKPVLMFTTCTNSPSSPAFSVTTLHTCTTYTLWKHIHVVQHMHSLIHHLWTVSTLICHPQGVIITKVHNPTCQSRLCS